MSASIFRVGDRLNRRKSTTKTANLIFRCTCSVRRERALLLIRAIIAVFRFNRKIFGEGPAFACDDDEEAELLAMFGEIGQFLNIVFYFENPSFRCTSITAVAYVNSSSVLGRSNMSFCSFCFFFAMTIS